MCMEKGINWARECNKRKDQGMSDVINVEKKDTQRNGVEAGREEC